MTSTAYFIIIRGPLGVGKTTVSKKLVQILNADYISIDEVLQKRGLDKADEKEGTIPAKNFIAANEFVLDKVKKTISSGKIVIFDGCFHQREQLDHLLKSIPFPHHGFTLKASVEACIERDSKRAKVYGKEAAVAVHSLTSKFDYGIVVDTSGKTVQQTTKDILSHLPQRKDTHK